MLKKIYHFTCLRLCKRMTYCCCTARRWTVAQSYAKKFHFRFPFGFEFEFQQQKQSPKKKGGTKSSQAALLALYLARERERVRERKRIQRQRAQLRWKWNERVSERPAERIRNNRNGRLRARVTPSGAATPAEAESATPAEQRIAVSSPFTWV